MKRLLCILLCFFLLCMAGCSKSGSSTDDISNTIGIDLTNAEYATRIDTHGGFNGDGNMLVTMSVPSKAVLTQIESTDTWQSLPLSRNLTAIVYGTQTEWGHRGPYITFDDSRTSAVPDIENGYYFFLDRHRERTEPHDDTNVLSRASFNLTLAIYDCDTETLYYLELDT